MAVPSPSFGADVRCVSEYAGVAASLAPQIAARASATIAERRVPRQSIDALKQEGLTRILQPRRCGGSEARLMDHYAAVSEVARSCGSTAWCLGVYHAHAWLMGLFGRAAQDDVYAGNRDALVSAVLTPRGKVEAVADGYRLSGVWPFCSGVHHAEWVMLGCRIPGADGAFADEGVLLVPASDLEIRDDWYAAGLTGTGSNSVVATDVVVPRHRFLSFVDAGQGKAPGAGTHATPLYRASLVPVLALFITSPVVGMAEHALGDFIARLPGRVVQHTFDERQIERAATHLQVGEAASKIELARLRLETTIAEIEAHAEAGTVMPPERRMKARMDCATVVELSRQAVERIVYAAGASALMETSGVQQAARDVRAAATHGLLNLETNLETYGRVVLGLEPRSPTI